jgi:outer membrane receptor protein involved in Fe transport
MIQTPKPYHYVLTLLLVSACAFAQGPIVEGSIKDPSGAGIAGATVKAFGPTRRTAQTDEQGRYRLENLRPGRYRMTAVAEGFALREWEIDSGSGTQPDVVLNVAPVASVVETVSKTKEEALHVPFLVTDVQAKELRETAAASFDEVLRSVAGLQHATQGNFYTRITTRGLRDTADLLTLVDGIPFRQMNGSADLGMLPVTALQGAEFVKGTAASIYGRSSIGGVVQFYTVPESTPKSSADLAFTYASFDTYEGQGSFNQPAKGGRIAASGVLSRSEGYQKATGRDTNFLTVMGDHAFSPWFNLRLSYLGSDVTAGRGSIIPLVNGRPIFGITPKDNFGIPGVHIDGTINSYSGKIDSQLSDRVVLSNTFNFNRYDRLFQGGITIVPPPAAVTKGYSENNTRQDSWLNDTLVTWETGNARVRNTLLGGMTFDWGSMDQASPTFTGAPTYRGPDYNTPVTNINNDPRGIRGPAVTSFYTQNVRSYFAQNHFAWNRLGITLGLRTDSFDQELVRTDTNVHAPYSASKISPRVGADFTIWRSDALAIVAFGNFAQGFRPQLPSLNVLNNVVIPQLLRPEVTRNTEGGFRLQHKIFSGQISYFNMRKIDGQRSFRSGPEDFVFVNATSRVRGMESEIRARLPRGLSWYGNYAHHDARNVEFRPTLTSNFDGYRLRMSPRNIAGTGLTFAWNRFVWNGSVAYVGSRPLRDNIVNPQFLPSYTVLNSSLSTRLGPLQVVLAASNLANRYYIADDFSAQEAGCPGLPRRVSIQIRYHF